MGSISGQTVTPRSELWVCPPANTSVEQCSKSITLSQYEYHWKRSSAQSSHCKASTKREWTAWGKKYVYIYELLKNMMITCRQLTVNKIGHQALVLLTHYVHFQMPIGLHWKAEEAKENSYPRRWSTRSRWPCCSASSKGPIHWSAMGWKMPPVQHYHKYSNNWVVPWQLYNTLETWQETWACWGRCTVNSGIWL